MKLIHFVAGLALIASTSSCTRTNAQQLQNTNAWLPQDTRDLNFLSYLPDKDTEEADKRLRQFLEVSIRDAMARQNREFVDEPVRLSAQPKQYEEIIRAFAERSDQKLVARITPYAYVAAEMLGAKFDILAVYRSEATQSTTYQSWFVLRRADIVAQMCEAAETEAGVLNDIQAHTSGATAHTAPPVKDTARSRGEAVQRQR